HSTPPSVGEQRSHLDPHAQATPTRSLSFSFAPLTARRQAASLVRESVKSLIAGLSTAGAVTFLLGSVSSGAIPPPLPQPAKPFLGDPQTTVAAIPSSLPAGFSASIVFSGLTNPTNVCF